MKRACHFMIGLALAALIANAPFAATLSVKQDGTGNFASVQAAIEAAAENDVIEVFGGTYNEDLNIGHLNVPSVRKDNLTLRAAAGESVEIIATNTQQRVAGLAAAGFDSGPADRFGFVIHGSNILIENIRFAQTSFGVNALNVASVVLVAGPDVTFRNCEIAAPGLNPEGNFDYGDFEGIVVATMDVFGLTQGAPTIATNTLIENCTFTGAPFALAISDFLGVGAPPEILVKGCEFTDNQNALELDDGTFNIEDCVFRDNQVGARLSDDVTTLTNCIFEGNAEYGLEIDNQDAEDDDPPTVPTVTITNCQIINNGSEAGHHGIAMEVGSLTVNNSIIANNAGNNVFFEGEEGRETRAVFDHCDIYNSGVGVAVLSPEAAADIVTFTITNSIIVDQIGVVNNTIGLGDFTIQNCDIFTSGEQFTGEFLSTENVLNVDPLYVDAANGNFFLQSGSPVANVNGTFLGSKGVSTLVEAWLDL